MAFELGIVTNQAAALTARLDDHGIPYTLWNAEACSSSSAVEAQFRFESPQDQMAAKNIFGLAA